MGISRQGRGLFGIIRMKVITQNLMEIYCFFRAWVSFFAYAPGPDPPAGWRAGLASNAVVFKMNLRNNKTII